MSPQQKNTKFCVFAHNSFFVYFFSYWLNCPFQKSQKSYTLGSLYVRFPMCPFQCVRLGVLSLPRCPRARPVPPPASPRLASPVSTTRLVSPLRADRIAPPPPLYSRIHPSNIARRARGIKRTWLLA